MMCKKCGKIGGLLFLIFGILFLLVDLNVWNFWGLQWWTVLFILLGLGMMCSGCCPDCCKMRDGKK
jgi:uncharacterized membrane protein